MLFSLSSGLEMCLMMFVYVCVTFFRKVSVNVYIAARNSGWSFICSPGLICFYTVKQMARGMIRSQEVVNTHMGAFPNVLRADPLSVEVNTRAEWGQQFPFCGVDVFGQDDESEKPCALKVVFSIVAAG